MALIDLTNKQFGRWTVIKRVQNSNCGSLQWLCKCSCGTSKVVLGDNLRAKKSVSCGCYKNEVTSKHAATLAIKYRKTHGHANSREYSTWQAIKARCLNPNCPDYKDYGAKGIKLYYRWAIHFEDFLRDVGPRPDNTSLDRFPNKNGNYEPGNVRWATPKEQARNRNDNHLIAIKGRTLCISEWAEKLNTTRYEVTKVFG